MKKEEIKKYQSKEVIKMFIVMSIPYIVATLLVASGIVGSLLYWYYCTTIDFLYWLCCFLMSVGIIIMPYITAHSISQKYFKSTVRRIKKQSRIMSLRRNN